MVLARRIAWLGLVVAGDDVVAMDDLADRGERRMAGELGADARLVAEQQEGEVVAALEGAGRRRRPSPPGRYRHPSRRLRSAARCPPMPSPVCGPGLSYASVAEDFTPLIMAAARAQIVRQPQLAAIRAFLIVASASARRGCGACCAWRARFFSWGRPSWHLFSKVRMVMRRARIEMVNGRWGRWPRGPMLSREGSRL